METKEDSNVVAKMYRCGDAEDVSLRCLADSELFMNLEMKVCEAEIEARKMRPT